MSRSGEDPTTDSIIAEYWSYGAHNFSDMYGYHEIFNNQTGGANATAVLCYGYNGTNCTGAVISPQTCADADLTPINSIVLNQP